jgi:hypothetical protein
MEWISLPGQAGRVADLMWTGRPAGNWTFRFAMASASMDGVDSGAEPRQVADR